MRYPTYTKEIKEENDDSPKYVIKQQRALNNMNVILNFNECGRDCRCQQQESCLNTLILEKNRYRWKMLIKKEIRDETSSFWGLFALEDIPAGAFVCEYMGEIITKGEGDLRGIYYDRIGCSYLFDMNDPVTGSNKEEAYEILLN